MINFGDDRLPLRFWEKARIDPSGCWLWRCRTTYATFTLGGKQEPAHRVAYRELTGPIPDGLVIDHLCRVGSCVNPLHLEAVTVQENTRRASGIFNAQCHDRRVALLGRPRLSNDVRSVELKVSGDAKQQWAAAAKRAKLTLSEWIRALCNAAASRD